MKISELIEELNKFPQDSRVFVEGEDSVFSSACVDDYSKTICRSVLIRQCENMDYASKRFVCENCSAETKGNTYMRNNLLCKICCGWLKVEWEG